jgi:hypothetical protein
MADSALARIMRGMQVLEKKFKEADVDLCGSLTIQHLIRVLCREGFRDLEVLKKVIVWSSHTDPSALRQGGC